MRSSLSKSALTVAVLTSFVLMAGQGAWAESTCKGLDQKKCESTPNCTWVDGYTMKTGTKVDSYCRGKGGSTADKAAATQPADKAEARKEEPAAKLPDNKTKEVATPKVDAKAAAAAKVETKAMDMAKDAVKDKAKAAAGAALPK